MNTWATRGMSIEEKLNFNSLWNSEGCLIWQLAPNGGGYGQIWVKGKYRLVHRVALEIKLGRAIKNGLEACHSCHCNLCINPAHLREDTHQANIADRQNAKRHAFGTRVAGAKLDDESALSIRHDSRSERELAREYGVAYSVIGAIKRGKNWKHV